MLIIMYVLKIVFRHNLQVVVNVLLSEYNVYLTISHIAHN